MTLTEGTIDRDDDLWYRRGSAFENKHSTHTLVFHDRQSHEDDGLSDIITTTNVVMVWRLYALSNRQLRSLTYLVTAYSSLATCRIGTVSVNHQETQ